MMRRFTGVMVSTALVASATSAAMAGVVAGKVEVGSTAIPDAVVSIEGAPGAVTPQRVEINQQNKTFVPHVVAVPKGSVVELVNGDDFLHNTFSRSSAKVFNVNQPTQGSRSLIKVDQPGVIDVRCHIHGQMQAWIVVVGTPYYAVTDSKGLFRMPGVPAGTYKVNVWSERLGNLTQEVKVSGGLTPVIFKFAGH